MPGSGVHGLGAPGLRVRGPGSFRLDARPTETGSFEAQVEAAARLLAMPARCSGETALCVEDVVSLDRPGWSVRLGGTAVESIWLMIEPVAQAGKAFRRTPHLAVSYRAEPCDDRTAAALADRVAKRLARATFEQVDAWLASHRPPVSAGAGVPRSGQPGLTCPGLNVAWNHPRAWSRFFADEEFAPARDGLVNLLGSSLRIEHGDMECQFVSPRGFTARPWFAFDAGRRRCRKWGHERAVVRRDVPGRPAPVIESDPADEAEEARLHASWRPYLSTNILDVDVIEGSTPLLEDLLATVRRRVSPDVLMVNCTCVPQMVGDDVLHAVERERAESAYPILYKDQRTGVDPYERNVRMMRAAFAAAPPLPRDPAAVNLVGFTAGKDRDEIVALLEALGIRVNAVMIPDLAQAQADEWLRAPVQVMYPNPEWQGFYGALFDGIDIRRISPPAPFGPEASREWLRAVARALGREDLLPVIDRDAADWEVREWAPRVERARRHRLGIVCERQRLGRLEFPGSWGFRLVPVLREMGFGLSLAVVPDPGAAASELESARERWTSEGLAAAVVQDEAALAAWLSDPAIEAVFSDYFFDERLVRTGHAPFSLRLFEKGRQGAARTLDRLLDRCTIGCFRAGRAPGAVAPGARMSVTSYPEAAWTRS